MTALPCQNSCSWLLSPARPAVHELLSPATHSRKPPLYLCLEQWVATVHPQQEASPISLSTSHNGCQQYTHSRKPPLYLCLLHTMGVNSTPTAGSLPYISVYFTQWQQYTHSRKPPLYLCLLHTVGVNSTPTAGSLPYISVYFTQWVSTVHPQQEASPISLSTSHNGCQQYTHSRKPPLYLCLLHTMGGNSTPRAGNLPCISVYFTQWLETFR